MTSDLFSKLATRYVADPSGEWAAHGSFPVSVNGSVAYAPLGTELSQADRIEVDGKIYDVIGVLPTFGSSALRIVVSERTALWGGW